jgi:hypothetical protein
MPTLIPSNSLAEGACRRCQAEMFLTRPDWTGCDERWTTVYAETAGGLCPDPDAGAMTEHDVIKFDHVRGGFDTRDDAESFADALISAAADVEDAVTYRDDHGNTGTVWRVGIVPA